MISGYLTLRSTAPAKWASRAHGDLGRPGEVQPVRPVINSNTLNYICCAFTTSIPDPLLTPLTFVLRLRAGDDPLDQAALHERFPREPRLLPLPRVLHSAGRRLDAIGISQQAAIDHLAIHLEEREDGGRAGRKGGREESSGQYGNLTNKAELYK